MRQATVHGAGRNPEELAERYDYDGKPIPYNDTDHNGARAVYASAQHLVKFGMFHLGAKLVEQHRVIEDSTALAVAAKATSVKRGHSCGR